MNLTEEEFSEFYCLVDMMKNKGITFVVLDYVLPRDWNMVDTLVVVRNGSTVIEYDKACSQSEIQRRAVIQAFSDPYDHMIPHLFNPDMPVVLQFDRLATEKTRDINLTLHAGEVIAVFSKNHEVEQAFYQAISGVQNPIGGRILIDGIPVSAKNRAARIKQGVLSIENRSSGSYSFENMSVFDNYCLPKGLQIPEIWRSFRYRRFLRAQIDLIFGRSISYKSMQALSPMEVQTLKFKSCLLTHPKILVCLNPFSSVDMQMSIKAHQLIQEIANSGTAVLLLSQYRGTKGVSGIKSYFLDEQGLITVEDFVEAVILNS